MNRLVMVHLGWFGIVEIQHYTILKRDLPRAARLCRRLSQPQARDLPSTQNYTGERGVRNGPTARALPQS
jgi:hypothetical protein